MSVYTARLLYFFSDNKHTTWSLREVHLTGFVYNNLVIVALPEKPWMQELLLLTVPALKSVTAPTSTLSAP